MTTTTILGRTYKGLPAPGSTAFILWHLEQQGHPQQAQQMLDNLNRLRATTGLGPLDLAGQMMLLPLEGGIITKA